MGKKMTKKEWVVCPHCKAHPLEVRGTIDKSFEGEIDDKGFMADPITDSETIIELACANCGKELNIEEIMTGWS